ncbi:MAG: rhodanese-related sulfurtransferase [Parvicellaceae bacterium]|jgi:rhodanese-related sulfurtransferase
MKYLLVSSIAIIIAIAACGQENVVKPSIPGAVTETNETNESVLKRVSKEEFKIKLAELSDIQLVDVRTPAEFSGAHMGNAVNIDFKDSNFEIEISKLDLTKPTMIYCHGGGRSAAALKKMGKLGFAHVLELEGGYSNW